MLPLSLPEPGSLSPIESPQTGVGWRMTQSLTLTEPSIFNTAAATLLDMLGFLHPFSIERLLSGGLFQSYH